MGGACWGGSEGAVVGYRFGEEEGAEEEDEGFGSVGVGLVVIVTCFGMLRGQDIRFPGNHV